MSPTSTLFLSLLASQVTAHTYIWGVYVNGVDQGTSKGIRTPAYNGAPNKGGYNNGPVKDLSSIDLRCNVLGDIPAADTIKVVPGDHLTFDWHHDYRNDTDDIIASSHHGPTLIYISPDPPTSNSFVKLWHSGKYQSNPFPQAGKWATTSDLAKNFGHMDMRIPDGLAAGHYLIRAELIALHEADVSWAANHNRGAQFYPDCVQIEVLGNGTVTLPEGVSFPGAYSYEDPGVVHNVYCSTETKTYTTPTPSCTTSYIIPGPTVWSGAWVDTTKVNVPPAAAPTTHVPWSTWIVNSVVTSATYVDKAAPTVVGTSVYTASWGTVYETPVVGGRW